MRIGIFIDASNLSMNGGGGMKYDTLTQLASQGSDVPQRLNAYIAYDVERAKVDPSYRQSTKSYHSKIRGCGFKVCITEVKTYSNADGTKSKSNADMDLAVDLLLQSDKLDRVILGSGDGDFVRVVSALQDKGLRVDVLGFKNISRKLIESADGFLNGALIPNLLSSPYTTIDPSVTAQHLEGYHQMTGTVIDVDMETRIATVKCLSKIPCSFLHSDKAWTTVAIPVSEQLFKRSVIRRNHNICWVAHSNINIQPVEQFPILNF